MEEEYRVCFENYEISNLGNCRKKLPDGNFLEIKGSINNRGYRYFQINRSNKRTNYHIHQEVAYQFLGERPENMVIDHKDRNKLNNCVENLHYTTQKGNMKNQDRYRSDILETDKLVRHNIISRESDRRTGRFKGVRREKGTGSVAKKNNKFYGIITKDKIRKSSLAFDTKEEAENWLLINQ
jgi:hypothetical protein